MNTRYDIKDTTISRKILNAAWTSSLKQLMQKYPDDHEIKALYVDAVMLEHSWDFWYNDGTPKAWTPEVVTLCESLLKSNQHHPAALHYYIHVTEASRQPQVALPAADKLKVEFPGIAHMVHMSSHEYERNGLFAEGVAVNEKSDEALGIYDSLVPNLSLSRHVPHYYAVEAYCAISGNIYKKGMPKTYKCRDIVSPSHEVTYDQYLYMFPELAMVRMGKWDEILKDTTKIDSSWTYASIIQNFVKGMAHTHFGNTKKAWQHLENITKNKGSAILAVADLPDNPPLSSVLVAEETLRSFIFFKNKNFDSAVTSIKRGILVEDSLIYSEPKDWLLPARQYLGYYLLTAGRLKEAEQVYKDDLIWNPGNGWSAIGLFQTLAQQKRYEEAEKLKSIYMRSFSEADELPPASIYK
jgi:tetratricopeptide (TPR) repeat protein